MCVSKLSLLWPSLKEEETVSFISVDAQIVIFIVMVIVIVIGVDGPLSLDWTELKCVVCLLFGIFQLFCIHPSDSWLFSCSSVCLVTIVCGAFILSSVWACVWVRRRWKVGYFFHSSGFWGSLAPGLASASVFMCDSIMQQAPAVYLVSPSVVRVPESLFLHSLTLRPCLRTKMFSYRNTQ